MMRTRVCVGLTLIWISSAAFGQLRPEHEQIMNQFAVLRADCVEAGFQGEVCDTAQLLADQLEAAGVCFPAEQNPYYCREVSEKQ